MERKGLFIAFGVLIGIVIGGCLNAWAAEPEKWKEISAPEVKSMIESGDAVVIHVLSEIEYNMQHITGSINIPIIRVATSDKLPNDKNTPLIFYCMGKR